MEKTIPVISGRLDSRDRLFGILRRAMDEATGFETRDILALPFKVQDERIDRVEVINKRDVGQDRSTGVDGRVRRGPKVPCPLGPASRARRAGRRGPGDQPVAISPNPERWEKDGLLQSPGLTVTAARELLPGLENMWLDELVAAEKG